MEPAPPSSPSQPPPAAVQVLQQDADSRVEVLVGSVVRKSHTYPWRLCWRTFLTRSRAEREYRNLDRLRRAGVSCVRPLSWSEKRTLGCVRASELRTECFRDACSLSAWIADARRRPTGRVRIRRAVEALGALARRLHDSGFVSTTLQPRNVLVRGDDRGLEIALCDQPSGHTRRSSALGSRFADVDLYDMAFSPSRRRQLRRPERLRLVLAYCGGDRARARRIWRRLSRRPRWLSSCWKELVRAASCWSRPPA